MKRTTLNFANLTLTLTLIALLLPFNLHAQQSSGQLAVAGTMVPRLMRFSGVVPGAGEGAQPGVMGIEFAFYAEATGGSPLWMETQNVRPDTSGHYSVLLGSTTVEGLPANVFTSEQAHWVGVRISGQEEQPRVLLLSVPYALKAGDAETIGGLPPSAFMLAPVPGSTTVINQSTSSTTAPPPASSNVTTTGGTVNAIPLFSTATNIQNSILTQTAATAINVAGKLNLPANGTATATGGKGSRPETFVASAFNSGSSTAVAQTFQLQAEAAGNNTATPFGTLNLLYGSGTTAPVETGFKINNKGVITFATGQTFPLLTSMNTFTGTERFNGNVGVGGAPSASNFQPLTVSGTTNFGTWLALANTSAGGHTWNIISAGSGNAEGAGNLGITDLTGKSTIWLEGNTNTTNLTATGTAAAATVNADPLGQNAGGLTPGIVFGFGSGEGIASNRTIGLTKYGLDFYTDFTSRMSVLQNGRVGIGTSNPGAQVAVVASANGISTLYLQAADAVGGSGQNGSDGLDAYASSGDPNSGTGGGNGVTAYGGGGGGGGGTGGIFQGGSALYGGNGIYATGGARNSNDGIDGTAGYFDGDVFATGSIDSENAITKIDHPLDPANKYLSHSSVESSEMKNMYDGTVTTDASGDAVVELPDWFEAINRDFRYQLTVIGQFAQAIVDKKISGNSFAIKTDKPNVEVSWQVTGIRQDAWANAHRTPVEQQKDARERGHYLHPELYGAPEEMSVEWARHPEQMKRMQEMRKKVAKSDDFKR
jgi:trimeric autotransporter adhesin